MADKTEWEVVDPPSVRSAHATGHFLQALLGRWWKWKVAGAAVAAAAAVLLLATVAGILLLVVAIVAISAAVIVIGIARLKRWLRRKPGSFLTPR